jgi:hypothetical protein
MTNHTLATDFPKQFIGGSMGPGRRRDEAPPGHLTVRDAAEILGVTEQAIRQRLKRGTLPEMDPKLVTEGGGEPRHYIPREAVERALAERDLPARKADTDEVRLNSDRRAAELREAIDRNTQELRAIRANQEGIRGDVRGYFEEAREATQTEQRFQRRTLELMEEQRGRRPGPFPWKRVTAVVVALLLLLVFMNVVALWHVAGG